jgi:cyclopropane-fatty-acyl-phospholipid synthase
VLGDCGRGLLHFIGRSEQGDFSRWIRKRIFPGAHAPTLSQALQVLEPFGYFVRDVENLRSHYALTLEHWLDRFDKSAATISATYSADFVRAWRLYLAGSIAGFRTGTLQLFQIVFSGAKSDAFPATRDHLYATGPKGREWTPATS